MSLVEKMFDRSSGKHSTFRGRFEIVDAVYRDMKETAASQPSKEIGGMLFGRIDDAEGLEVEVQQVVSIPERWYSNSRTHFEIDPEFASHVIDEYTPERKYLGNWHSHLGYGGPSSGDYQQVADFFENNEFREYLLSIILDRKQRVQVVGEPDYEPIVELYRCPTEHSPRYETLRIQKETIELVESTDVADHVQFADDIRVDENASESSTPRLYELVSDFDLGDTLTDRLYELIDEVEREVNLNAPLDHGHAYLYDSGRTDEVVICFPVSYRLTTGIEHDEGILKHIEGFIRRLDDETADRGSEGEESLDVFLALSVPLSYPQGEIFIDLSSRDLTKQLTIHTVECDRLGEDVDPMVETIEHAVENHVPELLQSQLISIMRDNIEWSQ